MDKLKQETHTKLRIHQQPKDKGISHWGNYQKSVYASFRFTSG